MNKITLFGITILSIIIGGIIIESSAQYTPNYNDPDIHNMIRIIDDEKYQLDNNLYRISNYKNEKYINNIHKFIKQSLYLGDNNIHSIYKVNDQLQIIEVSTYKSEDIDTNKQYINVNELKSSPVNTNGRKYKIYYVSPNHAQYIINSCHDQKYIQSANVVMQTQHKRDKNITSWNKTTPMSLERAIKQQSDNYLDIESQISSIVAQLFMTKNSKHKDKTISSIINNKHVVLTIHDVNKYPRMQINYSQMKNYNFVNKIYYEILKHETHNIKSGNMHIVGDLIIINEAYDSNIKGSLITHNVNSNTVDDIALIVSSDDLNQKQEILVPTKSGLYLLQKTILNDKDKAEIANKIICANSKTYKKIQTQIINPNISHYNQFKTIIQQYYGIDIQDKTLSKKTIYDYNNSTKIEIKSKIANIPINETTHPHILISIYNNIKEYIEENN